MSAKVCQRFLYSLPTLSGVLGIQPPFKHFPSDFLFTVKILLKSALNTKTIEKWLATFHSLLIESWLGSQTPRQDLINDKRLKVS